MIIILQLSENEKSFVLNEVYKLIKGWYYKVTGADPSNIVMLTGLSTVTI